MYFRQIYKLITANFFINDKKIETNPNELVISKTKTLEIILEALYNYPELKISFEGNFHYFFKEKEIKYYELMNFIYYENQYNE